MFNFDTTKVVLSWKERAKEARISQKQIAFEADLDEKTVRILFSLRSCNPTIRTLDKIENAISSLEARKNREK